MMPSMFWLWAIFLAFCGAVAVAPQATIRISLTLVWVAMAISIPASILFALLK